jgi:D-alanine-D-alanine ligase
MKVALIFGGCSREHAISLRSAQNIWQQLLSNRHEVALIGVNLQNQWFLQHSLSRQTHSIIERVEENPLYEIFLIFRDGAARFIDRGGESIFEPDIAFPIIHGSYGEDGSLQGYFKQMRLPFVGADVLASAMAMDKDITKRLLQGAGIAVSPGVVVTSHQPLSHQDAHLQALGMPLFVKPASLGSSVGVSKVSTLSQLEQACLDALKLDNKVLIEKAIVGREIEFAVLGNDDARVSLPGEIVMQQGDVYSYDAKYISQTAATLVIPADIPLDVLKEGQRLALLAYQTLGCTGMSRVDFFLTPDHTWILNEINTLPGFTDISMYPKMWEASGLPPANLIEKLLILGLETYHDTTLSQSC